MKAHPVTLALALAAGVGWFGFPGLVWDVAWHRTIGRDSFLSPPHVLMYAGVAANGLVAAWVLVGGGRRYGAEVYGRLWLGGRRWRAPAGFTLVGLGFVLALAGAVLDEAWHRFVGKDVNLWSPPHLTGLAGTMLIVVGLLLALAGHTRYDGRPGWWPIRLLLLFFFADLIHKSMVALDHYTLDPWGRTPDFYPFLLALLLPAILVAATRAVGPGGATGAAFLFSLQHGVTLLALLAADMRVPTFSPCPLLPALAVDLLALATPPRWRERGLTAVGAGVACVVVVLAQESAWMAWGVGRPWPAARVVSGALPALLAGAGSAWVGWVVAGFVRAAGGQRAAAEVFGGPRRRTLAAAGMLALVACGLAAAYRPSRSEPPASLAALGLAADIAFDHRDAVFWDAQLPDDWREPGLHRTYQEGIIDGRPFPVGPAWCAPDEATLERELSGIGFSLRINGEPVPLERYPTVGRRLRDGTHCRWIAVSMTTPRPGRQELVYGVRRAGRGETATVTVELAVKEP